MKKGFKLAAILVAVGVLALGLVGCGQQGAKEELIVGTEPTFPPFEYTDEKTQEITGFDIELIKAIAKEAGYTVKVQSLGFEGLINAVQTGNIDVVMAGMTIDAEREKEVAFGTPYFDAGLMVAVPEDNTTINSVDDLKGKKVAVQIGTTGADKANELKEAGIVKEVKTFNTMDAVFMELLNGTVDAVINDKPVNEVFIAKNPGKIKMVGEILDGEQYGFAVSKENEELLNQLNEGFEKVKASGKYDELKAKYFGS
jgi:ABC-type amino acid transport substrate-binding protein